MLDYFKRIERAAFKEDARKLGVNLITGSVVAGFLTHVSDMTLTGLLSLAWVGVLGFVFWIFGLSKVRKT